MVKGATSGLLVLGSIRRWAVQAMGNKQYCFMTHASAPASGILFYLSSCPDLLQLTSMVKFKANKPFSPQLAIWS